tara:strand:+ start:365 stop:556 length:192 start_codon:yes stop_codon:yes gene_type:complete
MDMFEYRLFIEVIVAPLLHSFTFFPPLWLTWYLWIRKREKKNKGIGSISLPYDWTDEGNDWPL